MPNANELRRRKLKDTNGRPAPPRKRKEQKGVTVQQSFLCLIISGTILTLFFVLYSDNIPWYIGNKAVDSIAAKFGYSKPVHAVVIDAGSTGSRVLAFTFHESYFGGYLVLDKELFRHTKPGLSSFADNPEKGAETIASLLEEAKNEIPEAYWSKTPLILKATAGLRLLPQEKAENLLNAVRELFKRTPFLTDDQSVEIMDGTDEGISSWFTVNFLLDRLHGSAPKTVAALDLGGGSTQVTFSALTPASLAQKQFIHKANAPGGQIPVYTHSYLGLGLMAARKEILTLNQPNQTNVTSECVNHIITGRRFTYGGVDYLVSGPQDKHASRTSAGDVTQKVPIVDFDRCSAIIIKYVTSKAKPPEELASKVIFAFSYYFDRAIEAGLIDETTGGQVKVKDFRDAAKKSCNEANEDQPFMCLDLSFIWVLLTKGFGLNENAPIFLYKKIKGHEISWALGVAYGLLRG